jgi:PAS domain S-box-containing protein
MLHAMDIILILDEDLRVIDANQQAIDTYGWSKTELLQKTIHDLRGPNPPSKVPEVVASARAANGTVFESLHQRKDGTTFPCEVSVRQVELDGRPHLLSVLRDITERKRAEATLRASEERYRLIADNTSDVIWLYDHVADQFTYASPAALPMLGYLPEEIVGLKILSLVAPTSHDAARRALDRALTSASGTRAPVHLAVELEMRRKDGRFVPVEVVTSVLADASGKITHILGVNRDITERKKAREALEKFNVELEQQVELRTAELAARNREIEALVESIPDTVLLCDEQGELITTHFPQSRASAFPFAGVSGGDGFSRHHPVLIEIARELHTVAWASQQTVMLEFDRNIEGSDRSIEARATPAGENRLLILLRDISARKRVERATHANLERERQLSEMKSQFISVASHEFRTPLAAAVGSLELLERHAARMTEAKRVELLGRIQRSLGRLTSIMDDVLHLSRVDAGRVKVKRMDVDVVRFVQDIINDVETGDRQQHRFEFQARGEPTVVPVDTNLMNHIVSNLLGNAVRYSPAGTTVSVTVEIAAPTLVVTVADEGIGIPEAERDHVFEPFVRGSNVGTIAGTGLGLNIVKRYTEMMGGRIELLAVARGATFRVQVPLEKSDS